MHRIYGTLGGRNSAKNRGKPTPVSKFPNGLIRRDLPPRPLLTMVPFRGGFFTTFLLMDTRILNPATLFPCYPPVIRNCDVICSSIVVRFLVIVQGADALCLHKLATAPITLAGWRLGEDQFALLGLQNHRSSWPPADSCFSLLVPLDREGEIATS